MANSSFKSTPIAIIGGGLCGLALAIALEKRSIPYTLYEARSSFTEIGAGINLAPNSLEAFDLIDPSLGEVIFKRLATRNPPGRENIWLSVRLGAATLDLEDARVITDIQAPPTGNTTVSRAELLQEMASRIPAERVKFNMKLIEYRQMPTNVGLRFSNGQEGVTEHARFVIACDGAHSSVRHDIMGHRDRAAASPQYSQMGGYRAILPLARVAEAVGEDIAVNSHIWSGPNGYIIMYPINGGRDVNIGVWTWKKGNWKHDSWVLDNQKAQMLEDYCNWGPTVQRLLDLMSDETQFWATFHHSVKPSSYSDGRLIVIGDAAHSMGPHQGQGAAQSMEDAYVMAEVLSRVLQEERWYTGEVVRTAFTGYEAVRRVRFERVLDTSYEAMSFWSDFWRPDLTEVDLEQFSQDARERMAWIWDAKLEEQGKEACSIVDKELKKQSARNTATS